MFFKNSESNFFLFKGFWICVHEYLTLIKQKDEFSEQNTSISIKFNATIFTAEKRPSPYTHRSFFFRSSHRVNPKQMVKYSHHEYWNRIEAKK